MPSKPFKIKHGLDIDGNIVISGLTSSTLVEVNSSKQLISVNKKTAFNKDFAGSGSADTVARSDHSHPGQGFQVYIRFKVSNNDTVTEEFKLGFSGTFSATITNDVLTIISSLGEFSEDIIIIDSKSSCIPQYINNTTFKIFFPPNWESSWGLVVLELYKR